MRLKDKLGTRSLPSAEIEFRGARGWLVGEDGRGMVPLVTNLSHARSGPAVSPEMRAALDAAIHHCRHRSDFGERLADQPAMANVLADLAIALMHLSAQHGDDGSPMRRITTTVMEYWGCGRVTGHIAEAMQCLGGNGYSEASGLPRLLRDAAVHPIWEGSGDVVALDTGRLAESPSRCAPHGRGSGRRVHRESARALLHLRRCRCLLRETPGARPRPGLRHHARRSRYARHHRSCASRMSDG
jgi:putative acyl-CoA dehydrogenase